MKIRSVTTFDRPSAKELLVAFVRDGRSPELGATLEAFVKACKATGDLATKARHASLFYPSGRGMPKRVLFVGLGRRKDLTTEALRRAAAVAQKKAEALEVDKFLLKVTDDVLGDLEPAAAARAVAEGLLLGAYRYDKPSKKKASTRHAQNVAVQYTGAEAGAFTAALELGRIGAAATAFARDLENMSGNVATPTRLAAEARKFKARNLSVKVFGEAEMKRFGMDALLGVSQGSAEPAKLIVLDYKPPGAKKTVCIVGKGLTFDTGGISIKPSAKMEDMRFDMCGGGAVLGLFHAICHGGLKGIKSGHRVVGIIPASENMPDGRAQKPGDVRTACDGTTIEILNTDAEGRLILADALAYAKKTYQPDQMVDLATLTGAVVVALGHEMAGIMGTDDDLIDDLIEAGQLSDEPLWQLPLWEIHRQQVKSKFADVANLNSPAHGNGSSAGGAFLSYFTEGTPWAHIDIAGAAWGAIAKDYYTGGATGTAVRTLLTWVRSLA